VAGRKAGGSLPRIYNQTKRRGKVEGFITILKEQKRRRIVERQGAVFHPTGVILTQNE